MDLHVKYKTIIHFENLSDLIQKLKSQNIFEMQKTVELRSYSSLLVTEWMKELTEKYLHKHFKR